MTLPHDSNVRIRKVVKRLFLFLAVGLFNGTGSPKPH